MPFLYRAGVVVRVRRERVGRMGVHEGVGALGLLGELVSVRF